MQLYPLSEKHIEELLRSKSVVGATAIVLSKMLQGKLGGNVGLVLETLKEIKKQGWLKENKAGRLKAGIPIHELRKQVLPVPETLQKEMQQKKM